MSRLLCRAKPCSKTRFIRYSDFVSFFCFVIQHSLCRSALVNTVFSKLILSSVLESLSRLQVNLVTRHVNDVAYGLFLTTLRALHSAVSQCCPTLRRHSVTILGHRFTPLCDHGPTVWPGSSGCQR